MPAFRLLAMLLTTALAAGESLPGRAVATLIAPAASQGATSVEVAIAFRIDPGSHLYWLNPGDSGLPPRLRWALPDGWTADPPRFPAPERHAAGGQVTYIHADHLTLLCTLRAPALAVGTYPLGVRVDWLACDAEACVPGSATLAGALQIVAGPPAPSVASASLAAARDALPVDDPSVAAHGDGEAVVLRLPTSTTAPVVFPAADGFRTDHGAAQPSAGGWQVRLPLATGTAMPARFIGVVRLDGRAIAIDTPITRSQP